MEGAPENVRENVAARIRRLKRGTGAFAVVAIQLEGGVVTHAHVPTKSLSGEVAREEAREREAAIEDNGHLSSGS